jgi:anaerobic ribonucleoside-triphosphate reductase
MNSRTITRIKKRDGSIVDFTQDKITNAVTQAMASQGISMNGDAKTVSDIVTYVCEEKFGGYTIPSVEQIQDIVEMVLMRRGYHDVAKSYILYRERHKAIREAKSTGLNLERLIKDYINDADWKIRENSNEGTVSFSGLNARVAGEVLSNYALNQIYTEPIKKAHQDGDFHLHDLSYPIVGYCAGWSLENLFRRGFGHVANQVHSAPAKHLETATLHMVNYIGTMQGEFAGAQAFSSVDTFLAPFVRHDKLDYEHVKQDIQKLVFGLNVPSRWGWQTPFSNLTFDWTVPDDLRSKLLRRLPDRSRHDQPGVPRAHGRGRPSGPRFHLPHPDLQPDARFRLGFAQRQTPVRGHGQVRHPLFPELHRDEHEPGRHPGDVLPPEPRPA